MSTDDGLSDPPPVPEQPEAAEAYGERPSFRAAKKQSLIASAFPVTAELPRYRLPSARRDLIAGLTVAALAFPSAMAYGEAAGLSPINGLYALLLPTVAYTLLGSARRLIVGPEASVSTLVAAAVLPLAAAGSDHAAELAAMLALLVAACFLLARLLRLGWIADYFSRPVLVGYLHGIAIVLVIGQLGKLLGVHVDATRPLREIWEVVRELGQSSGYTIGIGLVSLAALLAMRRVMPALPAALIVVVGAIAVSWGFDLASHGVAVVGPVPGGLPRPTIPTPSLSDVLELAPAALGVFLVSFADEILTARAFAGKHNEHVRASQELLVMGAANAAAGITQGFSIGASGSRTAVNEALGARTQIAGLVAAVAVAVTLLFLTEPIQYLPASVLAAVIISAAIGIVDPAAWRALAAIDRVEVAIAGVTTVCVVYFGVLQALVVAVGLSIIDAVRRSARPYDAVLGWVPELEAYRDVALHPSAEVRPGVVVYRLDDRLFFANAEYVKGRVREAVRAAPTETSWLVFDADAVNHVDATGVDALLDLESDLRRDGITLVVAGLPERMLPELEAAGLVAAIGAEHFHPTVRAAVAAAGAGP
jgi:high affinity sulfate transporter 1